MPLYEPPRTHRLRHLLFLLLAVALAALALAWLRGGTPRVRAAWPRAVGLHTRVTIQAAAGMGLGSARVWYEQAGREIPVWQRRWNGRRWWLSAQPRQARLALALGRGDVPGLHDGPATLVVRVSAANLRHSSLTLRRPVVVRSRPPSITALTAQQYIVQGGAELVVYRVSPGVARSGVSLGGVFFSGHHLPGAPDGTDFCLFAYPYNARPPLAARLEAVDDAGNRAQAAFPLHAFPQHFRQRPPFVLTRAMLQRLVPPILAHAPGLKPGPSLAANFTLIDQTLAQQQLQQLRLLSRHSRHSFLWRGAFVPLPHAKLEARFADSRQFVYHGRVLTREVHLGDDLASVAHTPIPAANAGRVMLAGYFGIFGNTVVLDHGYGLMTLYGHMNDFAVQVGQSVVKGQTLGHSDSTGLALGDHVHFSVLVDGIMVNPLEWWDPRWLQAHLWRKLAQYGNTQTQPGTSPPAAPAAARAAAGSRPPA